jgi:hypothetical protein
MHVDIDLHAFRVHHNYKIDTACFEEGKRRSHGRGVVTDEALARCVEMARLAGSRRQEVLVRSEGEADDMQAERFLGSPDRSGSAPEELVSPEGAGKRAGEDGLNRRRALRSATKHGWLATCRPGLAGNPKEETAGPEARKKTSTRLLPSALVDQHAGFEANDPIPEEAGISVRLVSLIARPRLKRARPLRAPIGRAGFSGMTALFKNRWICVQKAFGYRRADDHLRRAICWTGLNHF